MRAISIIWLFLITITACNSKRKNSEEMPTRIAQPVRDTFNTADIETSPRLQEDILLDTLREKHTKDEYDATIIIPYSLKKELPAEYKKLQHYINEESAMAGGVADSTGQTANQWGGYQLQPMALYRDSSVISYSFESAAQAPGAMRHFFKYYTINYDLSLNKPIEFDDFFIMQDSSAIKFLTHAILGRCLDMDSTYYAGAGFVDVRETKFSFDDEYVYFYLDMFKHMNSIGIVGSIKRKYIPTYIRPEYR